MDLWIIIKIKILQTFVSQQLLFFLFSKHLDTMSIRQIVSPVKQIFVRGVYRIHSSMDGQLFESDVTMNSIWFVWCLQLQKHWVVDGTNKLNLIYKEDCLKKFVIWVIPKKFGVKLYLLCTILDRIGKIQNTIIMVLRCFLFFWYF